MFDSYFPLKINFNLEYSTVDVVLTFRLEFSRLLNQLWLGFDLTTTTWPRVTKHKLVFFISHARMEVRQFQQLLLTTLVHDQVGEWWEYRKSSNGRHCLDETLNSQDRFKEMYGKSVKRIWISNLATETIIHWWHYVLSHSK